LVNSPPDRLSVLWSGRERGTGVLIGAVAQYSRRGDRSAEAARGEQGEADRVSAGAGYED
jgi:hypothetical protein